MVPEGTELLDITLAKFFVQKHIYPQYACHDCKVMEVAPPVAPAIIESRLINGYPTRSSPSQGEAPSCRYPAYFAAKAAISTATPSRSI